MVLGGVEKELITILKKFDPERYDLTVLLCYIQEQEIVKEIPDYVKLIVLNPDKSYWFNSAINIVKSRIKKGLFLEALRISYKSFKSGGASSAYVDLSDFPCDVGDYDYAVCYHMHSGIMLGVVAEKIKAKYKIAWIHNDFETTGYKINNYKNWLDCYDKFIGVSQKVTAEFININPEYREKAKTVYNVVDENEVFIKAEKIDDVEKCFIDDRHFKIVTVGRFVEQKGLDIAINTCELLKKRGVLLRWYVIGYGEMEEEMRRLIAENDLKEEFIILGKKQNPYPYMKRADLYVQTSRHEGCPITIDEAMILKKIVVTTNIAGASERIDNWKNGIIVPGFSAEEICEVIFDLFENKDKMDMLQKSINESNMGKSFEEIENVFCD